MSKGEVFVNKYDEVMCGYEPKSDLEKYAVICGSLENQVKLYNIFKKFGENKTEDKVLQRQSKLAKDVSKAYEYYLSEELRQTMYNPYKDGLALRIGKEVEGLMEEFKEDIRKIRCEKGVKFKTFTTKRTITKESDFLGELSIGVKLKVYSQNDTNYIKLTGENNGVNVSVETKFKLEDLEDRNTISRLIAEHLTIGIQESNNKITANTYEVINLIKYAIIDLIHYTRQDITR